MNRQADRWTIIAAKVAIVLMVAIVVAIVAMNTRLMGNDAHKITDTTLVAPFSALGFLTALAGLAFTVAVALWAMVARKQVALRSILVVALTGVALYAALLVAYSERSHEVLLQAGEEKYFCELDCHLAYTVAGVERNPGGLRVTLRTRFDPATIAPWRGDGALTPNPRRVLLLDQTGRVLEARQVGGTDLRTPLRPGDSYTTDFEFGVSQDAAGLRLLVKSDADFPERVLIGNENSFLHRKVYFRL